jgi:hypothetical protein
MNHGRHPLGPFWSPFWSPFWNLKGIFYSIISSNFVTNPTRKGSNSVEKLRFRVEKF